MAGGKALAPSRQGTERTPVRVPPLDRAVGPARGSHRGLLLHLQRQAGNRAVARLARSVAQRVAQRKAGWSDADREGAAYNAGERAIGAMRRIPIEGLTSGYQGAGAGEIKLGKTDESAAGRAIVVVPAGLAAGKPVDVLLHLHGYTGREVDPYGGWRQRKSDHAVRDVALDRIEQQLEGAGNTQLIAVLPQGAGKSDFGNLNPDTYIGEVLDRLAAVGAVDARPKLGHVLLSAHSGGGHTVKRLLDNDLRPPGKRKGAVLPAQLGQLMLYDAINSDNELKTVQGWVEAQLDRALAVLADSAVPAAGKEAYLASSPRFVGYYASYAERYRKLDRAIQAWFDRHAGDLGGYAGPLRDHFQVHAAKGLGHELAEVPHRLRSGPGVPQPHRLRAGETGRRKRVRARPGLVDRTAGRGPEGDRARRVRRAHRPVEGGVHGPLRGTGRGPRARRPVLGWLLRHRQGSDALRPAHRHHYRAGRVVRRQR
jgi:hypothetical protein